MKRIAITSFFLFVILFSCQSEVKFDKIKWQTQEDPAFPPLSRKRMLNDLLSNYNLNEMNKSEVKELLGIPDFASDSNMIYKVVENYGSDVDPVYTKQLELELKPNQSVSLVKVNEWKK